jgi:hypothetical protein
MNDGFARLRNGLREHIKQGKISPQDLGIYLYLHYECNWATGIYHGSALGIAYGFDNPRLKQSIQRSLTRLRENKYINYRKGDGTHKGYNILINKFEPQGGKLSNKRLNAWKNGSKCVPFYEEKTDGDTDGDTEERRMVIRKGGGRAADGDTERRPIPEVPDIPDVPNRTEEPAARGSKTENELSSDWQDIMQEVGQ